jgi:hypothetical protein
MPNQPVSGRGSEHQTARQADTFRTLSAQESFEPAPVSNAAPMRFTVENGVVVDEHWIESMRDQATRPSPYSEEWLDGGHVRVSSPPFFYFGGGSYGEERDAPMFKLLPSAELADELTAKQIEKGALLTVDEILFIATNKGRAFTPDAINELNAAYYTSPEAFNEENGLATFFVGGEEINTAFANCIATLIPKERIRMKELSTGGRSRWNYFSDAVERMTDERGSVQFAVTLTDHTTDTLPADNTLPTNDQFQFSRGVYSLFDDFEYLEPADRFDVLLATYGFDSIWLPGDHHYHRQEGKWYQAVYRVAVPDWHPDFESSESFRNGAQPLNDAPLTDLKDLPIEVAWRLVDLETDPNTSYLTSREDGFCSINIPAGIVRRVEQAFQTQLQDDGIFIIGETASYHPRLSHSAGSGIGRSGLVARYKVDDLWYAQQALEEKGFFVQVLAADEFIYRWAGIGDGMYDINDTVLDQCVMIVSRRPFC